MLGLAIVVGLDHLDLQIGPPRSVERRVRIVVVEIEDLASGYLIILGEIALCCGMLCQLRTKTRRFGILRLKNGSFQNNYTFSCIK